MSRRLDLDPLPLDGNTAERILSGSVPPADAPPGYAGVARVFEVAAFPPQPAELAGEVEAVALIISSLPSPRRSHVPSRKLTARLAAAAFAGGLTLTSGLAAAGALPTFAQDAAADVLDTIGLDVPSSADRDAKGPADEADNDRTGDRDGDDRRDGDARDDRRDGDVRDDRRSDGEENHGAVVSDTAQDVDPGPGHGAEVCAVASDGKCGAGEDSDGDEREFADQIDRCRERGEEQRARFEDQDKDAQADAARERAAECRDRFREKREAAEDRAEAKDDRADDQAEAEADRAEAKDDRAEAKDERADDRADAKDDRAEQRSERVDDTPAAERSEPAADPSAAGRAQAEDARDNGAGRGNR